MKRSEVLKIRKLIEKAVESLSDGEAVQAKMLYPKWINLVGESAPLGYKFQHNGELYKVVQVHTFQAEWRPEITTSLYERIDEQHEGTAEDPIPYNGNMELFEGLYYIQESVIYKCIRSTGTPVYNALEELVGIYTSKA